MIPERSARPARIVSQILELEILGKVETRMAEVAVALPHPGRLQLVFYIWHFILCAGTFQKWPASEMLNLTFLYFCGGTFVST